MINQQFQAGFGLESVVFDPILTPASSSKCFCTSERERIEEATVSRKRQQNRCTPIAPALHGHPNIAKVLDAGTTDAGRPFFVMELVRGIKITDYSDQANLTTKERLDLFIKVCQAIQHAHQKGIIQRDISTAGVALFSSDGSCLAASSTDDHVQLWRAPSFEEIAATEAKEKTESKQP